MIKVWKVIYRGNENKEGGKKWQWTSQSVVELNATKQSLQYPQESFLRWFKEFVEDWAFDKTIKMLLRCPHPISECLDISALPLLIPAPY